MSLILETVEIKYAKTQDDLRRCFPVMHELRPHLTEQVFMTQVPRQLLQGYHLVSLEENGSVKALAGFRVLEFLAWGKVLYIDDLITATSARKKGYGGKLLQWVIEQAKAQNCDQVHLDSGPQRHDAHRLYLNHGFKLNSHHFALELVKKS